MTLSASIPLLIGGNCNGDDGTIIRNYYDTSGALLRREVTTAFIAKTSESAQSSTYSPSISKTVTDDYVGDLVFSESEYETSPLHGNSPTIRVVTPTGFIDTAGKVHSHVRDYQGNVRQVLDEEGNVEQSSDYYPYGMLMGESDLSATSASPNPFRFGGKHYLTAASVFLHDFAARFYDAATITFTSHDAITTNSYPTNPFLYCGADPINRVDPTGMSDVLCEELQQNVYVNDGVDQVVTVSKDVFEQLQSFDFDPSNGNYGNLLSSGEIRYDISPTVNNVLKGKPFEPHYLYKQCYDAAVEQNNVDVVGPTHVITVLDEKGTNNINEGISYINSELAKGHSVVVGVWTGKDVGNNNKMTGHFINIVSVGIEWDYMNNKFNNVYHYYDNGTPRRGTNLDHNTLRFGNFTQKGVNTRTLFKDAFETLGRFYKMTEVRIND